MFPSLNFRSGYAFTRLEMKAGLDNWNSAATVQTLPKPVPLLTPQRVSTKILPYYEYAGKNAKLDLYVEFWGSFSEPTGKGGLTGFEVMIVQRMVTSPGVEPMAEGSYWWGAGDWYNVTYRAPDVPFLQWSEQTFDLNVLLFKKLEEIFGCDLSKGVVGTLMFGVEGFALEGSIDVAWDYVRHEMRVS